MIADPKPYPAYKDSGVEWLGEVPEGWDVIPVKRMARASPRRSEVPEGLRSGTRVTFLPMEKVNSDGTFQSDEVVPIDRVWDGFTYFRRADVILAKITPCFENGKGACLDRLPTDLGFGSTEFIVLRPSQSVLPRFLNLQMSLPAFRRLGTDAMQGAGGQKRVPTDFVASFQFPLPPLDQQTEIVRFIDHIDARIQQLISAKERLIELLEEEKQAIIHRAVTRGLDPDVPLKPSGVDWLRDVPSHWTVTRVKNEFLCLNYKRRPLSSTERGLMERRYDYYGASGVIDRVTDYLFDDDLLLVAEDGANLVLRNLPLAIIARGRYWVNNHAHILKPRNGDLEFMAHLMESLDYRPYISGAAQPKLTQDRLLSVPIVVPPPDQQREIRQELQTVTRHIDATIDTAQRHIALLREYRTRLISDVVTGKLDVREAAKQLPDDPEVENPVLDEQLEEAAA